MAKLGKHWSKTTLDGLPSASRLHFKITNSVSHFFRLCGHFLIESESQNRTNVHTFVDDECKSGQISPDSLDFFTSELASRRSETVAAHIHTMVIVRFAVLVPFQSNNNKFKKRKMVQIVPLGAGVRSVWSLLSTEKTIPSEVSFIAQSISALHIFSH